MAAPGDWIEETGGGVFAPAADRILAGGSFVHHRDDGTLHCSGTWTATDLTSFVDFGKERGQQGGVVSFVVSHHCDTMDMTMTGIPMTVTSVVSAPSGSV